MLESGSYEGEAEGLRFEFRVGRDAEGSLRTISADVTRDGAFVASLICEAPREEPATGQATGTVKFRGHPDLVSGGLRLEVDGRGIGSFYLSVDLEGNYRDVFAGRLERRGDFMRRLTIEIDGIEGTKPPSAEGFAGRSGLVTIARAFETAGFETTVRVDPFRIKAPDPMRARGYTLAEIHSAMEAASLRDPADGLHVHMFVCSYLAGRDGRGVLGVMYDYEADLNRRPREGVAVFYDHPLLSDPRVPEADRNREYVFTAVHEIGHALNLLHSFDKARPSALSWMQYPHLYPKGYEASRDHDGTSAFWRRFPETFDADELVHLHHASVREIAAGGFPFGTYEDGLSQPFGGPGQPRLTRPGGNPLRAIGGIDLAIASLKRVHQLGEPVFVSARITNATAEPIHFPDALDPAHGYLRFTIRSPSGRTFTYRPPARMCTQAGLVRLPARQEYAGFDGIPLFLGADGPVFTEPGDYEVRAELAGVNGSRVLYSKPATVRIAVPDAPTEDFARRLWDNRGALHALYLRHPLAAHDAWNDIAEAGLPGQHGNTTEGYFDYIAGLGWATPFAPGHGRREYHPDFGKAAEHMRRVDPSGLPQSVRQRVAALCAEQEQEPARLRTYALPHGIAPAGPVPLRAPELMRASVPPGGLFGSLGLDGAVSEQPLDPLQRIVPSLRDEAAFADIVSWNIEHFHNEANWIKIPKIAELIRSFRCDFWALQEVDERSLAELTEAINTGGNVRYGYIAVPGSGQQSGAIFRRDTTRVRVIEVPGDIEAELAQEIRVELSNGKTADRKVFHRRPMFLEVQVSQGAAVFDFRCAIVHLKSTDTKLADTGSSIREASARTLARWIARDRESGTETDYLILGDMNAETARQGLAAFSAENDLALLSLGMREDYGHDALTRVASRRLLDHIVVTRDLVAAMPEEDLGEQLIVRSDLELAAFTKDYSDHIPVAVRFIIGD